VERITQADRACAVAAAAAHDLNNELTVILSGVAGSLATLEPGHPARPLLCEARSAVQRCAWKTSSLLTFSARHGARRSAAPMEVLIDSE
jgi:signal transduction histidine kinase